MRVLCQTTTAQLILSLTFWLSHSLSSSRERVHCAHSVCFCLYFYHEAPSRVSARTTKSNKRHESVAHADQLTERATQRPRQRKRGAATVGNWQSLWHLHWPHRLLSILWIVHANTLSLPPPSPALSLSTHLWNVVLKLTQKQQLMRKA